MCILRFPCCGEALFLQTLANTIDKVMASRRDAIADKNKNIFGHSVGYPLPDGRDADTLVAVGILLALQQQMKGRTVKAVGEKTPENVFFFPRLLRPVPKRPIHCNRA